MPGILLPPSLTAAMSAQHALITLVSTGSWLEFGIETRNFYLETQQNKRLTQRPLATATCHHVNWALEEIHLCAEGEARTRWSEHFPGSAWPSSPRILRRADTLPLGSMATPNLPLLLHFPFLSKLAEDFIFMAKRTLIKLLIVYFGSASSLLQFTSEINVILMLMPLKFNCI